MKCIFKDFEKNMLSLSKKLGLNNIKEALLREGEGILSTVVDLAGTEDRCQQLFHAVEVGYNERYMA